MASSSGDSINQIIKLNGTNYQSWKFNVRCLLMAKGLWEYVRSNNLLVKPELKELGEGVTAADVANSKALLNEYLLEADKA